MDAIKGFRGEYRFLSNFYGLPTPLVEVYEDNNNGRTVPVEFPTLEHAYQATKYRSLDQIIDVANCASPVDAKRQGRRWAARPDWEKIKLDVMLYFVRKKFAIPELQQRLLDTGDADLWEVNRHGDLYWGVDEFLDGDNHLGQILMQVRQEIQDQF